MKRYTEKIDAVKNYIECLQILHAENILTNKKDFTCQIGEWLVETLYDGKRAISGIQKGWDVDVNGRHIQVKTHAKAEHNTNRWSAVDKESTEVIDELIIIVFSFDYKLKEFYKIPWENAVERIRSRGAKKPRFEINWSSVKDYKIEIKALPKQELISFFL